MLVALAAGELEGEHEAQLRAHLELCANCQAAFAEINRAAELAGGLKLASPEVDRYPEFLRRLAAREAELQSEAAALTPVERALKPVSEANASAAGMAAVIPLFGNRLAVRNGFGQGFDLSVTSRQGKQWLHLSAKSLTRVAAVTAGVSLVAGISVVSLLLLFFSWNRPQPQTPQRADGQLPNLPLFRQDDGPWIQTASAAAGTLAIWKENAQLQAGWIEHSAPAEARRFTLALPPLPQSLRQGNSPPRMAECSVATDGESFVVLREVEGGIYLWRLEKDAASAAPPMVITRKGAQPDVAWIGDRYVAVWVVPDAVSPVVEMIELGSDGRALQTSATVVARTDQGDKVGLPGVAGSNGRVLICYFLQSGALLTRIFVKAGDNYEASNAAEVGNTEGPYHRPVRLLAVPDGYLACWDVANADGAEIRLAKLDQQGKLISLKPLARARTPITSFDLKLAGDGRVILLWSEVQPGGALTFTQSFSFDGDPLRYPQNVFVADNKPSAVVFGDAEGTALVWPGTRHPGKFQIGVKVIGKQ